MCHKTCLKRQTLASQEFPSHVHILCDMNTKRVCGGGMQARAQGHEAFRLSVLVFTPMCQMSGAVVNLHQRDYCLLFIL